MRQIFILLSIFVLPFFCTSQINATYWGIIDTNLTIEKNTDFGTVHDYLELFNYSGQDLEMRWIAHFNSNWPSLWTTSFTDPANWHQSIVDLDSANFTITDPIGFQNKLIIGVEHKSQAGASTIDFKVFPINHPEDTLWLHYEIIINQGNAFASLKGSDELDNINIVQTDQKTINISNIQSLTEVTIFNLLGSKVYSAVTSAEKIEVQLHQVESGLYIVKCQQADGNFVSKKIVI